MKKTTQSILSMILLSLVALLLSACQPIQPAMAPVGEAETTDAATTSEAALPEVVIVGKEYSFEGPKSIPSGWTQITFDNQGDLAHDLLLFKLDEGKTMDDVMTTLESEQEDEGPPEWIEIFAQLSADAAAHEMAILNLVPGLYGMISFGESADGPPDFAQGMVSSLTVTAEANGVTEAALPQTDASIELVDFSFIVNGLQSGEQLVRVSNSGKEPHEVVMFRLKDEGSFAELQALFEAEAQGEEVTDEMWESVGEYVGAAAATTDHTAYVSLELAAGTYAFVCFLPSEAHEGKQHHELGMIQQVIIE